MQNSIILYESRDGQVRLDVQVNSETIWLNRQQIAELFNRDVKTIGKHINNVLQEELKGEQSSTVANFATVEFEGTRKVERQIEYHNLDVIILVGYRVKLKRVIKFRRWANSVLKDYILKGYAINQHRLNQLNVVVQIIKRKTILQTFFSHSLKSPYYGSH